MSFRRRASGAAMLALLVTSCGPGDRSPGSRQSQTRTPTAEAISAERIAAERGVWNRYEVEKRLTEAGLVVGDSASAVRHPQLAREGESIRVSGAELELYIYENSEARRTDAAALDTVDHSPDGAPDPLRRRYIVVNNMIAVLRTGSSRLAERVELALTARHTGS